MIFITLTPAIPKESKILVNARHIKYLQALPNTTKIVWQDSTTLEVLEPISEIRNKIYSQLESIKEL